MLSCTRITSIEYYEAADRTAAIEAGKPDPHAGRDQVAYYDDGETSQGVWWTRTVADRPQAIREELPGALPSSSLSPLLSPPSSPFGQDGSAVKGRHLRDLAKGVHPTTGKEIVEGAQNKRRSAGFDLQISAPKSVSILAAVSGEETQAKIFAAHDKAMRRVLDHAFDKGLIVARRSVEGEVRETPAAGVSASIYRHFTSRAKDPQLHSHAVLTNVAIRDDGECGAIDNRRILQYGGALAALYRNELAGILREDLGYEVVRKDRNFEVAGVSEEVIKTFSKRRADIEKAMDGKATATNREAAQVQAYETRAEKDRDTSIAELQESWHRQLKATGWDADALRRSVEIEAQRIRTEREAGLVATGDRPERSQAEAMDEIARAAIEATMLHTAVVDDRLLMRDVLEALQVHAASADEALACVDRLKSSGFLLQVGLTDDRPVFSTKSVIETERTMLLTVRAGRGDGKREYVPAAAIEAAIAARPTMRDDQAKAVRHALNGDTVSIVEGYAGSGKSFSMGAVAEVARQCGREVFVIAPSWKATNVIREDTGTAADHAFAVPGFLERVERGLRKAAGEKVEGETIDLPRGSLVILDEGGMVGLKDMARLVDLAKRARVKLVVAGDSKQLQPVMAGSPMAAMARVLGSSVLGKIQRQRVEWQRQCSELFPAGRAQAAMQEYEKNGRIEMVDGKDALVQRIAADYCAHRRDSSEKTRTILSGWNSDVRQINDAIRATGKAEGWIGADDTTLSVIPRGSKDGKAVEIGFAAGDDVIFGESVLVQGRMIRNADIARIESIATGPEGSGAEPRLTVRFRDGQEITAGISEFVGFREEDGKEAAVPKIQHASAMTVHAAQGVTVDQCYVANVRGMGRESAYVAMTRHRDDVTMYVEAERITDHALAKREIREIKASKAGATVPEEEGDRRFETVRDLDATVRATLFAECSRADAQANASDFHQDINAFLDGQDVAPKPEPATVEPKAAHKDPAALSRSRVATLAARMKEREALPVRFTPAPVATPPKGRITADEFNAFRRIDLAAFAEKEGLVPVGKWEAGKRGERFCLFQDPSRSDGSKINIAQWPDGNWSFAARDGSASGDITKLLAWRTGKSSIACAHELRSYLGTRPDDRSRVTPETVPVREIGTRRDPRQETSADAVDPEAKAKAMRTIRFNWQRMEQGVNAYLRDVRGIATEILQRFRGDIRTEPNDPAKPWFKGGTACFAHRDLDGALLGYERKGEEFQQGGKRSFSRMAKGSEKAVTMMGEREAPRRVYIAESAVEALSVYQHEGQPSGALLCSPYGNPRAEAVAQVAELARRHPDAEFHLALNNDEAGRVISEKFEVAIREANPEARIVAKAPGAEFKDWNDQVRGITAAAAEEAKRQRMEVERERLRQEEEAKKREEERLRREQEVAVTTPRPAGPRMR